MSTVPDDDLVRHTHALRCLARSLVAPQDADDLVQDAALQALRRPPAHTRSWLAWLAGVVKKRAAKHHRGRTRRERRESALLQRELDPATLPLRVAAHRETIARLHAALLALPEPYHGTLLLRYFEELTPGAIAAHTGEPLATVKSRLQRGLELLRQRLAEDEPGRDWRAGLVTAFGLGRRSAVAGLVAAGVTTMVGRLVLGVLAAACAALWLWPVMAPVPAVLAVAAHVDAPEPARSELAAASERNEATPASSPSPVADAASGSGARATYVGRCIDEQGAPLAGASIVAACRDNGGDVLFEDKQTSAADGTFCVRLLVVPKASRHAIEISCTDHCDVRGGFDDVLPDAKIDIGDVLLPLACRLGGRVVDHTGAPQQGVSLGLTGHGSRQSGLSVSFSGSSPSASDGSFEYARLPVGRYTVFAANRRLVHGAGMEIELGRAARSREVELVVEPPPDPCHGIVVGENDAPLAEARVRVDAMSAETGSDGRFEVTPDPNRTGVARVSVRRDGYLSRDVEWRRGDAAELRIVLSPQPALTIRVVDAGGAPVTEFEARVVSLNLWGPDLARTGRTRHDGGVFRASVPPGDWHVLVKPQDATLAPSAFAPVHVEAGHAADITVVVAPLQQRRLVVTDGAKAVAGVHVELLDAGQARVRRNTETFPLDDVKLGGPPFAAILQEGTTDADGALPLRGPRGALALRLSGGGVALQIVQPVRLDEAGDLVVTAERAASWRGKLTPPDVAQALLATKAPPGLSDVVAGSRARDVVGIELATADGESLHRWLEPRFPFAADGSFAIDGLPSGTWRVVVGSQPGFVAGTVTLRAGEVLTQDVDVRALAPADVTLRVRVDGIAATNAWVDVLGQHAVDATGRSFRSRTIKFTDHAGCLRFRTYVGDLAFHVIVDAVRPKVPVVVAAARVRAPGPQELTLDLRLCELDLDVHTHNGAPAAEVVLELCPVGARYPSRRTTAADGSLRIPVFAGNYVLRVLPKRLATQAAQDEFVRMHGQDALEGAWMHAASLDVVAGAARRHRITLPDAWVR